MPRHPPCALELLLLAWLAQIPSARAQKSPRKWAGKPASTPSLAFARLPQSILHYSLLPLRQRTASLRRKALQTPGASTPGPARPDVSGPLIALIFIMSKKTLLVELRGLEPRTPCLQSRCSSQLSYSPFSVRQVTVCQILYLLKH
jgi:hypothetical protein